MCTTCKSDIKRAWGPQKDFPEIPDEWVGNWICIKRCPECKALWVESPFEPYGAFPYMVIWDFSVDDFKFIHGVDDSKLIHEWLKAEIRVQIQHAEPGDRKASEAHNNRSYGHYDFGKNLAKNPVNIRSLLNRAEQGDSEGTPLRGVPDL